MIDIAITNKQPINFDQQWFYNFSDQLGNRNLTYSMLDQVIFGCHLYRPEHIQCVLDNFSQAQIVNIYAQDSLGNFIVNNMAKFKLNSKDPNENMTAFQQVEYQPDLIQHERVLNVPFGFLFNQSSYNRYYASIREFLGLSRPLICFDYVEFYLSKQNDIIRTQLEKYSQTL
jgi:hypothetical protein